MENKDTKLTIRVHSADKKAWKKKADKEKKKLTSWIETTLNEKK